jgi:ferrous iron transport protein B
VARARGIEFDVARLSELLGAPVVPTVGNKGAGMDQLLDAILAVAAGGGGWRPVTIDYGREIEEELAKLQTIVEPHLPPASARRGRWVATKLLEGDPEVARSIAAPEPGAAVERSGAYLRSMFGDLPGVVIADRRYGFIAGACQEAVRSTTVARQSASEQIDALLTHRVLGLPVFFGLMYLVFYLTFTIAAPPMDWIDRGFRALGELIGSAWPAGSEAPLRSLLVDGVIGGVGGVVVFLPSILLLFLAIALLEDSGYMARAAFIMDRAMHKVGLHGRSFIAMLLGFGCTVPAIMASRTLESRHDRLATMFVMPLMSCGARLTIYALFIPAFFAESLQAPILWSLYLIGILLALVGAKLLRATILRGDAMPFVMELPPYRMPTAKGTLLHMWHRGWLYLKKAGTVILAVSIVLWCLTSYPKPPPAAIEGLSPTAAEARALEHSLAGRIGRWIEPAIAPMGFDWRIGTALLGAVAAKEVFVAQLGIVYAKGRDEGATEPATLRQDLRANYSPLAAFCIMLFCLISLPCSATIAVMRKESGSWRWAILQFLVLTLLGAALATSAFQLGTLLGIGAENAP